MMSMSRTRNPIWPQRSSSVEDRNQRRLPADTAPNAPNAPANQHANEPPPDARYRTITWEASDPNDDELMYSLYFRNGSKSEWILLKDKLKEATFDWDTRSVADGRYEVKVVASDELAKAVGTGVQESHQPSE